MRTLKFKDVFTFSEIIDKMGLKADINSITEDAQGKPDPQAYAGGQMVMLLMSKVYKADKEICQFISDLTDKDIKEVEDMGIDEVKKVFTELMSENDLLSFFNSATAENQ